MPAPSQADPGSTGDPNADPNANPGANPGANPAADPPKDPLAALKEEDRTLIAQMIDNKIKDSIKDIKTKLDGAYSSRDEALKKLEDIDKKKREEELKNLEAAGKHKEAFDLKMTEANNKYSQLELENHSLKEQLLEATRNIDIKEKLRPLKFRSDKAMDMAYKEISAQLVKNDKGEWVHRSGIALNDFVLAFSKDEANSFLFVPEISTGAGTGNPGTNTNATNKSLFAIPQAEVLKMAAEGRLPQR